MMRKSSSCAVLSSCSSCHHHAGGHLPAPTASFQCANQPSSSGLRRNASAAASLCNAGSSTAKVHSSSSASLRSRRATLGAHTVFSTTAATGAAGMPRSRSSGFLLRAYDSRASDAGLCGSWDEEECCCDEQGPNSQPGSTSTSGPPLQLLPPFQWELPELEQNLPVPSLSSSRNLPPWGHEKQRRYGTSGGATSSSGRYGFQAWADTVIPPGVDVLENLACLSELEEVFVILFGVGEDGDEGIYSMKSLGGQGVAVDTVIVFENEVDAERYSGLLEAVMVWQPTVHSITPVELVQFVLESGLNCRLQPTGTRILPPDWNIPKGLTDWERNKRLRNGHFTVLEAEPEPGTSNVVEAGPDLPFLYTEDMDDVRRRLERLYSQS
eukprot:CAMPEP_0117668712 /NCGR_PEP_ID=MMETSP0804-20121206/11705_1 /TAXON_ID=1074897 /ORGANISM="Tetraselmis astigmatica, Strain CCMP880" /LENGTH=381 /DNA_ID=CAMNT_0005476641 /DNA_START=753 /DNA_END=1898 /DNA_ORIENTATION=+